MTFEDLELIIYYTPSYKDFLLQGAIVHNGLHAHALLDVASDGAVHVNIFYIFIFLYYYIFIYRKVLFE